VTIRARNRTDQDAAGLLGELEHADVVLGDEVAVVHGLKALQNHHQNHIRNQAKIFEKAV